MRSFPKGLWSFVVVVVLLLSPKPTAITAWTSMPKAGSSWIAAKTRCQSSSSSSLALSSSSVALSSKTTTTQLHSAIATSSGSSSSDADDDEYEYIEYDALTEKEFIGSEWLVGTNRDTNRNPGRIVETWCRLIVDNRGKNIAIWGDNSQGTWNLDAASQFLSISKENIFTGKDIWACTVTDFYYLQGTVRGWTYLAPASVLGQWQARRLGVDPEEAGVPPWFEEESTSTTSALVEESSRSTYDSLSS
jgi:hypothetical protein